MPGVELAAPRVEIEPYKMLSATAPRPRRRSSACRARHAELTQLAVAEGRFLDALDERDHAQVCVIGAGVARATSSAPARARPGP